jgi:hypothetical protein
MFPSLLTTVFWAFSAVCANRATRRLGGLLTSLLRLLLATLLLVLWAHLLGRGWGGGSGLVYCIALPPTPQRAIIHRSAFVVCFFPLRDESGLGNGIPIMRVLVPDYRRHSNCRKNDADRISPRSV